MMTTLEITPRISDKTARFRGTVAAGEHVAVTIKGGAEWLGDDNGAYLSLRVIDFMTGRTLALFPRPEETLEDGDEPDEWSTSAEDPDDLFCNLNLNTDRMVNAARHMLRIPVLFVMGAKDDENPAATRTLYFRDRYEVEFWPERVGDDTPYDLDRWPKQIDEWTDLVAEFGTRLTTAETNISQAESRVNAAIGAIPQTVATAVAQSNSGKADKVTNATSGNLAALGANGNLTDSGKKPADFADAAQFAAHAGNGDIHVTAAQKAVWTAKYDKPSGGIPKSDLAAAVQASLGKADTAIQEHQSLAAYVNGGAYDGDAKKILLKHDGMTVAEIDATAFIKDGMVDSVEISGGNLVISFNTDAGVEDIEVPLTDIFNPANFYDKTAADNRFVQKEAGKGLSANDYTALEKQKLGEIETGANKTVVDNALSGTSENPVQNKVVTAALNGRATTAQGAKADAALSRAEAEAGFTEWTYSGLPTTAAVPEEGKPTYRDGYWGFWFEYNGTSFFDAEESGSEDATSITFLCTDINNVQDPITVTATRTRLPTMADIADVISALALKADATSLPYALVTATRDTQNPTLPTSAFPVVVKTRDGETLTYNDMTGLSINTDGYIFYLNNTTYDSYAEFAPDGTFSGNGSGAAEITFGGQATTTLIFPYILQDRAINAVSLSGSATLAFPSQMAGKARDFVVRLTLTETDNVVPSVTFPADVDYETEGGEWPDLTEAGTYIVRLTEVPSESETARFYLQCSSAVADATPPSAGGGV